MSIGEVVGVKVDRTVEYYKIYGSSPYLLPVEVAVEKKRGYITGAEIVSSEGRKVSLDLQQLLNLKELLDELGGELKDAEEYFYGGD